LELYQVVTLDSPSFKREYAEQKLAEKKYHKEPFKPNSDESRVLSFFVPADDDNIATSCSELHFSVKHELRLKVDLGLLHFDSHVIKMPVEIYAPMEN